MLNSIGTYIRTISFIKPKQIYFRLKYRLLSSSYNNTILNHRGHNKLSSFIFIDNQNSHFNDEFIFLNKKKIFKNDIDWNYSKYGKLWCYNLNYLDFINQKQNKKSLKLIHNYISNGVKLKDGRESYPTSLRIINLIKFISKNDIYDTKIIEFIKNDTSYLFNNLEYHILGNHLLENLFSLWFSCHLFENHLLIKKTKKLLFKQLNEQILDDGAHFELSPMYHNIILSKLLDCISIAKSNPRKWHANLVQFCEDIAQKMLGWSFKLSIEKNKITRINDSIDGIAFNYDQLNDYAKKLYVNKKEIFLNESGIRILKCNNITSVIDISEISPSYQPGHSHADTFNYILYLNKHPIVVDLGISTYEKCERRILERSTSMHNNVEINNSNNNEIWDVFRVGRRAKVKIFDDTHNKVRVSHNGYKKFKTECFRTWHSSNNYFEIIDEVKSSKTVNAISYVHFHPNINIDQISKNEFLINKKLIMTIIGKNSKVKVLNYDYPLGFNKTKKAQKLKIKFDNFIKTTFYSV